MINALQPDKSFQVLQEFKDYYGTLITAGTKLKYISQNFSPYHGGYTLEFAEMKIYLQEDENAAIIDNFDLYFEEIP